jgi:hypothetical protein
VYTNFDSLQYGETPFVAMNIHHVPTEQEILATTYDSVQIASTRRFRFVYNKNALDQLCRMRLQLLV